MERSGYEFVTTMATVKLHKRVINKSLFLLRKFGLLPEIVDKTYDYYNKNTFWNDHHLVSEYMNELATGEKLVDWMSYTYKKYFSKKNNIKMLSIGCGNGWQDRKLDKLFNFKKVLGYDISDSLLKIATKKSDRQRFEYRKTDLNLHKFKRDSFDLTINMAALHHVDNMENVILGVKNSLKKGGLFVHFDYIGPKRNQYSDKDLELMNWMQELLPAKLVGREKIVRPDIQLMLKEDPSEAVGSEKIIRTVKKHFEILELKYLNGGLLYQVLYNQIQNFDQKSEVQNSLLKLALQLEREMTTEGKVKPLFVYMVAKNI